MNCLAPFGFSEAHVLPSMCRPTSTILRSEKDKIGHMQLLMGAGADLPAGTRRSRRLEPDTTACHIRRLTGLTE